MQGAFNRVSRALHSAMLARLTIMLKDLSRAMLLTKKQTNFLRTIAHERKPVIWLGQHGLSENVLTELETALDYHELVKIKLRVGDRVLRNKIIEDICAKTRAEVVQRIGNIVSIYRRNRKHPGITLPK